MEAQYGRKDYVPEREAYRHRFLMVVDGNSFSSRRASCVLPQRQE